jgi:hypothetical protein
VAADRVIRGLEAVVRLGVLDGGQTRTGVSPVEQRAALGGVGALDAVDQLADRRAGADGIQDKLADNRARLAFEDLRVAGELAERVVARADRQPEPVLAHRIPTAW